MTTRIQPVVESMQSESESDRLTDLKELLDSVDAVRETAILSEWFPPRLAVEFGTPTIPDGVKQLFENHGAVIKDVQAQPGDEAETPGLTVDIGLTDPLEGAGVRKIRKHGTSTVVTISDSALKGSNLEIGDHVNLRVRDGEIRITRQ